ncbi:hypothetical protein BKA64DRAFT_686152 [Cadophora sp. MPI-SDFR-AT-0126]|nr:hypothetical protein BKA64DRAFT_686152 [Leotiomycetes sp. MPI-SDFR-AT-0126]
MDATSPAQLLNISKQHLLMLVLIQFLLIESLNIAHSASKQNLESKLHSTSNLPPSRYPSKPHICSLQINRLL